MTMDIHVYDTYVKAKDGHTMHFDVITDVQDHDKAIEYAKQWLTTIGEDGDKGDRRRMPILSHTRSPPQVEMKSKKGFFIQKWKDAHKLFLIYNPGIIVTNAATKTIATVLSNFMTVFSAGPAVSL